MPQAPPEEELTQDDPLGGKWKWISFRLKVTRKPNTVEGLTPLEYNLTLGDKDEIDTFLIEKEFLNNPKYDL